MTRLQKTRFVNKDVKKSGGYKIYKYTAKAEW